MIPSLILELKRMWNSIKFQSMASFALKKKNNKCQKTVFSTIDFTERCFTCKILGLLFLKKT